MSGQDVAPSGNQPVPAAAGAPPGEVVPTPSPDAAPPPSGPPPAEGGRTRRRAVGLSGSVHSARQELATELRIPGTARMRKNDLIAAIRDQLADSGQATLDVIGPDAQAAPVPRVRRAASRPAGPPAIAEQPALPAVADLAAPLPAP